MIVSDCQEWFNEVVVDRLGAGVSVTFDDELASFKDKEQAVDYNALKKRVYEIRENEYNALKQVHRLMGFYESLGGRNE